MKSLPPRRPRRPRARSPVQAVVDETIALYQWLSWVADGLYGDDARGAARRWTLRRLHRDGPQTVPALARLVAYGAPVTGSDVHARLTAPIGTATTTMARITRPCAHRARAVSTLREPLRPADDRGWAIRAHRVGDLWHQRCPEAARGPGGQGIEHGGHHRGAGGGAADPGDVHQQSGGNEPGGRERLPRAGAVWNLSVREAGSLFGEAGFSSLALHPGFHTER